MVALDLDHNYRPHVTQRQYLIVVSCREDREPVQKYLRDHGLSPVEADEAWVLTATSERGRLNDGLYLTVWTTKAKLDLQMMLTGHGWDVQVIADREAKMYHGR
ncbi:hypothetical protein GS966_15355 [Rhodococcus hoagii]|nr:hypothetical protein [Prescottella equi]NKZ91302.1 hypothetical protein [Prescottella equi]